MVRVSAVTLLACLTFACTEEELLGPAQDAGSTDVLSSADAGLPDTGPTDAKVDDAEVSVSCQPGQISALLRKGAEEVIVSEQLYSLVANAAAADPNESIFPYAAGGVWLSTAAPIPENVPTQTEAIVMLGGLDQDDHPFCGSAETTWRYGAGAVRILFRAISQMTACADGSPVGGELTLCSDTSGRSCDGESSVYESTIDSFNFRVIDGNYLFGGSSSLVTFKSPEFDGVYDVVGRRGYAVFRTQDPNGTLFCIGDGDYQPSRAPGERSTLQLRFFRNLGTCAQGESVPGATLGVCVEN
ncbi:MAG: hypothetical protein IPG45_10820 [Deltaproteobacteria bacterium]|nr:hypothetical protein [Deltaproteobacteria bacterium]